MSGLRFICLTFFSLHFLPSFFLFHVLLYSLSFLFLTFRFNVSFLASFPPLPLPITLPPSRPSVRPSRQPRSSARTSPVQTPPELLSSLLPLERLPVGLRPPGSRPQRPVSPAVRVTRGRGCAGHGGRGRTRRPCRIIW